MSDIVINIFNDSCDDEPKRRKHHATKLGFSYTVDGATFKGENIMVTLQPGASAQVKVNPLKSDGSASAATLTSGSGSSSDVTVFTLVMDPTDPTGSTGTITAVATSDAQASLSWTSGVTQVDGSTGSISGIDQVFVTVQPPADVAVSLGFTYTSLAAKPK